MRVPRWSHYLGLTLAIPCLLIALALASYAVWEARPLPACLAGGLDPLNPAQKCRWLIVRGGEPVLQGAAPNGVTLVEEGTVSALPDFSAAERAALAAMGLYLAGCGIGWSVGRRTMRARQ